MPQTPVTFDGVQVVKTTVFGQTCRINGCDVFVGAALPLPGTTLTLVEGNVGRLVLPRWFVVEEGLTGGSA